nr:immunoglobulin light chain junction region [Macaca mulatta]
CQHGFGTPVTF